MWTLVVAAVGVAQSFSLDSGSGSGSGYPANAQHGECDGLESYWVQSNSEAGSTGESYEKPNCVPTAAGNLITYLAAKDNATVAYPYNYLLDERDDLNNRYNWKDAPSDQPADKYFLGGQIHGNGDQDSLDLVKLMKTDLATGTQLNDARSGLQQYLDNTNRLGKKKVVQVLQASGSNDHDFIGQFEPPYLLHIKLECLRDGDYDRADNGQIAPVTLEPYIRTNIPPFHGSELGHTIVVYDQPLNEITGIYTLKGASGLYESRTNNVRGCDETSTLVLMGDKTCIEGVTYITAADDDDGLSTGAIVAIAVGAVVVVGGVGAVVYKKWPKGLIGGNMAYAQFI